VALLDFLMRHVRFHGFHNDHEPRYNYLSKNKSVLPAIVRKYQENYLSHNVDSPLLARFRTLTHWCTLTAVIRLPVRDKNHSTDKETLCYAFF
jgi:hypothetical protein